MLRPDGDPVLRQRILNPLQACLGTVVVFDRLCHHRKHPVPHIDQIFCHIEEQLAVVRPDTGAMGIGRIDKGVDGRHIAPRQQSGQIGMVVLAHQDQPVDPALDEFFDLPEFLFHIVIGTGQQQSIAAGLQLLLDCGGGAGEIAVGQGRKHRADGRRAFGGQSAGRAVRHPAEPVDGLVDPLAQFG